MKPDWRSSILYLIAGSMECCWLYASLLFLRDRLKGDSLPVLSLLCLFPISFLINRVLLLRHLRKAYSLIICWLCWVLGLLAYFGLHLFHQGHGLDLGWLLAIGQSLGRVFVFDRISPEFAALSSSAVIWWMGRRLALMRVHFATLVSEFQFGLAIFMVALFSCAQLHMSTAFLIPFIVTFLPLALAGMSIAHARERNSWLSGPHTGSWFGFLIGNIGLIMLAGLLLSAFMKPELLEFIVYGITEAARFVAGLLVKLIHALASLFHDPGPMHLPAPPATPRRTSSEWARFLLIIPEHVRKVGRFFVGLVWFGMLLAALWRVCSQIIGWLRRKLGADADVQVEPMKGAFKEDLLRLLRSLLRILRIRWLFGARGKAGHGHPEEASIRRVYRTLLRWASARGCPRKLSQTPHEYLRALVAWLPEARWDFTLITNQYTAARYGPTQPTGEGLRQLVDSWQRIKRVRIGKGRRFRKKGDRA